MSQQPTDTGWKGNDRPIPLDTLVEAAMYILGIDWNEMGSSSRSPAVVTCRAMVSHIARDRCVASYPAIAKAMRRPTHSTAVACERKAAGWLRDGVTYQVGTRKVPMADVRQMIVNEALTRSAQVRGMVESGPDAGLVMQRARGGAL